MPLSLPCLNTHALSFCQNNTKRHTKSYNSVIKQHISCVRASKDVRGSPASTAKRNMDDLEKRLPTYGSLGGVGVELCSIELMTFKESP